MTTRRTFLKLAGAGALATSALGATCGSPPSGGEGEGEGEGAAGEGEGEGEGAPRGQDVGAKSSFVNGINQVPNSGVLVGKDSGGLYAMSAFCTHAGCDMSSTFTGFIESDGSIECLCHGSVFDKNGIVTRGPAFSNLEHYAVAVSNGEVFVDTNTVVNESTRA
jgi:nitrite reductase/ring-hydroxylating ferredoxin subunit